MLTPSGEYSNYYKLSEIFNDPTPLYRKDAISEVLYGLMAFSSQVFDPVFSPQVSQSYDKILGNIDSHSW